MGVRIRDFAVGMLLGAFVTAGVTQAGLDARSEAERLHRETPTNSLYTISELKAIYLLEKEQLALLDRIQPDSKENGPYRARLFALLEEIRDSLKGGRKGIPLPAVSF